MTPVDDSSGTASPALSLKRKTGPLGCAGCIGSLFLFVFCSLFFAAGATLLWFATLGPMLKMAIAQTWVETPCVIVSSEVIGDDTFTVDIRYQYTFNDRNYDGDRYWFFTGRTSGKKSKEAIVAQHPPGKKTVCYVDPKQPDESVLNRQFNTSLLWGLFSVPFLLVGIGGYIGILMSRRSKPAALQSPEEFDLAGRSAADREAQRHSSVLMTADTDFDDDDLEEEPGPTTLSPSSSRMGSFIGLLIFAVIWNGVVGVFIAMRMRDWLQGKWEWMPELILIPFGLIGLLILFGAFHTFLALFNPVPVLTLSRRLIPLGGTANLSWNFQGSPRGIRMLKITLKGTEEATYTRGTDTHTDRSTFYEQVFVEASEPAQIEQGQATVEIPTDTMHSLNGRHNKIVWQIHFEGEIPNWPNVTATFPIRVVPHE
ncbi:DUF3592 domain-containing protein [Planctomicrobium piriforme]|uniref:DUF3592 domain-containing protein n=1 Tax=Planctomicrobium piriforme TaxID=1576369 RepID=A0A1I3LP38_9PLAN|nr:DUF3592 domain-containing protein [Planctomicrobium piriforme]SFI86265.1 Protein of unknown function [Planctomicrobium piriforme]